MILVRKESYDSKFDAMVAQYTSPDPRLICEVQSTSEGIAAASQYLLEHNYQGHIQVIDYQPSTPVTSAKTSILISLHLNGSCVVIDNE